MLIDSKRKVPNILYCLQHEMCSHLKKEIGKVICSLIRYITNNNMVEFNARNNL